MYAEYISASLFSEVTSYQIKEVEGSKVLLMISDCYDFLDLVVVKEMSILVRPKLFFFEEILNCFVSLETINSQLESLFQHLLE